MLSEDFWFTMDCGLLLLAWFCWFNMLGMPLVKADSSAEALGSMPDWSIFRFSD